MRSKSLVVGLLFLPTLALVSVEAAAPSAARVSVVEAAKAGDSKTVRTAIAAGEVNVAEADGTTALHWAVRRGDLDSVDLLLQAGPR